ncbi:flagellar motor switch protein FliN [Aeoliella sp. ICT_H6.2]|uniref:Flagellar motor switch protein FliN n=1 Tax=Aeoliella straminimaris TaxID=2954799 RepID=A0A9X2FIN1_9BACT|nr:flagellar motor switch protein FliN [Aeoliella straminimaris]MCO6047346.1 flagellar motor switch protein FliN [Aeoliella straminimaris]
MADDPLGQDEIERLLAQAQQAGGGSQESEPAPPPPPPADKAPAPATQKSAKLDQAELDAMLASAGAAAPPPPPQQPKTTTQTAAAPASSSSSSAPPAGSSTVSQDDIELLLNQAEEAIASIESPVELPPGVAPFQLDDFGGSPASNEAATLELVRDVQLDLKIELGRTHMHLEDVLRLRQGAVVPLDKLAGDPVDLYVNGRMIARGEVLVLNDNFCVRVTELIVGDSACA